MAINTVENEAFSGGSVDLRPPSFFKKWGTMFVLSLALAIIVIDTTLLNVSLGTIIREFNTDIQSIQWVITAYSLILAAFTITGGRLGDLFGRKRMFMLGAAIFAVGSFITSISHSVPMMIWGEAIIEGIGAALMMPATASLIIANYKGRDRAIAFGIWGGIAGASASLGPILGGYLTTYYSWRWGFQLNIFVVLLLLLGSFVIKESRDKVEKPSLDWVGVILSALGLLSLVFGFIESSEYGWWIAKKVFMIGSTPITLLHNLSITILAIVWGLFFLLLFFVWEMFQERREKTPLVSLGIFKNRAFSAGIVTMGIMSLGMSGIIFSFPVFYQAVHGYDAFHTGLGLLPMSIAVLIMAPVSGILVRRFPAKRIIMTGLATTVIAFIVMFFTISPTATILMVAPGLALYGIGMGMVMAQISNVALSAVSVEYAGEASGINNTMRQVGATLGSAVLGAILLSSISTNLSSNIANSQVIPEEMKPHLTEVIEAQSSNIEFGGAHVSQDLSPDVTHEITAITHRAITDADKVTFLFGALFAFCSLLASLFLPTGRRLLHESSENVPVVGH